MLSFTKENVIIPKESIRYRIVANSNNEIDQYNKLKANEVIFPIINDIMNNSNNIIEARKNINKNIPLIEKSLDNLNIKYKVSFGQNYFPTKTYLNNTYSEGNYESLVIYLDEARGDNFWCVMFPPLCLIDIDRENLDKVVESNPKIKEKIISNYLSTISNLQSAPSIMSGSPTGIYFSNSDGKPKTIKEAGELLSKMLK